MKFETSTLKVKGKGKFPGKIAEIEVEVPQLDDSSDLSEAEAFFGGTQGVINALNAFLKSRAPSSFRTSVSNKLKTAESWDEVETYAEERASAVRDYNPQSDRGPSWREKKETLTSLTQEAVSRMSPEELRALVAKLAS